MKTTHKTPLSKLSQVTSFIKNAGILWQRLLSAFGKLEIYSYNNLPDKIKKNLPQLSILAALLLLCNTEMIAQVTSSGCGSYSGPITFADYGSYSFRPGDIIMSTMVHQYTHLSTITIIMAITDGKFIVLPPDCFISVMILQFLFR